MCVYACKFGIINDYYIEQHLKKNKNRYLPFKDPKEDKEPLIELGH